MFISMLLTYSNRGVSHLNEACSIDDVSRGSLSCPKSYYFAGKKYDNR